jgi:hypothetical protein
MSTEVLSLPRFDRYVGVDYSGASAPTQSLKGLRVFEACRSTEPVEVQPPPSPRKYWTRKGVGEWLTELLGQDQRTLVGIDHAFSFPLRYFETHHIPPHWPTFLDDFQLHWPTDEDNTYVDFVRDGIRGNGAARTGNTRWRRLTEERCRAKSVFHFDVQGQVAKASHAGIPWLRYIRHNCTRPVHFWPFDGWDIPAGRSAVVEVYPSLWRRDFLKSDRTDDQHDAFVVAAWLRKADMDGTLQAAMHPRLSGSEQMVATAEGWILGVP